jgi:serine/threonine-protein kinase
VTADLTGVRLGHYKVESVIGRGGMSVVYRAVDERLDRPVALKVMSEALSVDDEFRVRFTEEARAASAIDHVNVVPLYDFGEAQGRLFIAMRLVTGTDLAKEVAYGALPVRRTLEILNQVGAALDMLHTHGLVHLDVKPANVLMTRNESSGTEHVYVADFGLTRRGPSGHRTAAGDFLGSPSYASPEHLRGHEVGPASDTYSLTCMLFTCLAGRAPFVGDVTTVITGHLRGQVPSLSALTGLSSGIDRVIARGLAMDPAARYPTSADLLGSARRALTSLRDEDPIPAPVPRPTPFADRTRPSGPPGTREQTGPVDVPGPGGTGSGGTGPGRTGPGGTVSGPYAITPPSTTDTGLFGPTQVVSGQPKVGTHIADVSDRHPAPTYPQHGYPPPPTGPGQQPARPMGPPPGPPPPMFRPGPVAASPPPASRPSAPRSNSRLYVFLGLGVLVLAALLLIGYLVFGGRNDPSGPGGQTTTLTTAETSRPATGSVPSELLPTMIDPSLVSSIPGLSLPVQTSG